uniref:Glyco_tran_28_C domain-containing protein n=1 Tax=Parastrongyloides trichosuri TaxID=131310 RepID=A0A0N4ZHC0_PARTI
MFGRNGINNLEFKFDHGYKHIHDPAIREYFALGDLVISSTGLEMFGIKYGAYIVLAKNLIIYFGHRYDQYNIEIDEIATLAHIECMKLLRLLDIEKKKVILEISSTIVKKYISCTDKVKNDYKSTLVNKFHELHLHHIELRASCVDVYEKVSNNQFVQGLLRGGALSAMKAKDRNGYTKELVMYTEALEKLRCGIVGTPDAYWEKQDEYEKNLVMGLSCRKKVK